MNYIKNLFIYLLIASSANAEYHVPNDYKISNKISKERYFTNESGTILMNVNVWWHVNRPGQHVVVDGIDIPTLLSVVGGPKTGANLNKIKVFREVVDSSGKSLYVINLSDFIKKGDRTSFIKIMPNDTFIIPQSTTNYFLSQAGMMNVFLSMLNIYLQIENR